MGNRLTKTPPFILQEEVRWEERWARRKMDIEDSMRRKRIRKKIRSGRRISLEKAEEKEKKNEREGEWEGKGGQEKEWMDANSANGEGKKTNLLFCSSKVFRRFKREMAHGIL